MLNDSRNPPRFLLKDKSAPMKKTYARPSSSITTDNSSPPTNETLSKHFLPPTKPCSSFFFVTGEILRSNRSFDSAGDEISHKYQSFVGRSNSFFYFYFHLICSNVIHKFNILYIANCKLLCFCCLVSVTLSTFWRIF